MKPNHLFRHISIFTFGICLIAGPALAAPANLFEGILFESDGNTAITPFTTTYNSQPRDGIQLTTYNGGIIFYSASEPTGPGLLDGGVNLYGSPVNIILESPNMYPDVASFKVWSSSGFFGNSQPILQIDGDTKNTTFTGSNVSINGGSLSVSGSPVLTSASAVSQNFVQLGSGGVLNIVSTTSSTSSTTGALTVAGGLGVAKDAFINGIRIGRGSGSSPGVTTSNIAIGTSALNTNASARYNTAVGVSALENHVSGDYNTAVGYQTLRASTSGTHNTALGYVALTNNTTGVSNTALGAHALRVNTTGGLNSAMGLSAMQNNTTGSSNTALGVGSLNINTTGGSNTAVGYVALGGNSTGTLNVGVGYMAGRYRVGDTTPLNNTNSIYIGSNTRGLTEADDNSIVIGTNAEGAGSNTTVVGNGSTTHTYLKGETNSASLRVTGATVLEGDVVLAEAQGDISMGDYQ